MTTKGGKTVGRDRKPAAGSGCRPKTTRTGDGNPRRSHRMASLSALGMIENLEPLEDGERGVITLTASVAAQDAQVGQVAHGSCKAGGMDCPSDCP